MKLVTKLALAAALAAPSFAFAAPNEGKLSFTAGVDYASNYYFRGYLQENNGLIVEPYAGVTGNIVDSDDFKLDATIATWNSIHGQSTLAAGETGPSGWYESDLTGRLDATFQKFSLSLIYTAYLYPNGAFDTIQEVGLQFGYDDTGLLIDNYAFSPYIAIYKETDDGNGSEDTYGEIGLSPSYTFHVTDTFELPVSFPMVLGVSVDDYYLKSNGDNSFFGYASVAASTSFPLDFIPGDYGNWSLNLVGTYTLLLADSADIANNGDTNVFTGRVGISFTY